MGDRFLAALVIAALVVLTGWAIHGLSRYNDRLDGKPGARAYCMHGVSLRKTCKDCAVYRSYEGRCGEYGPGDMRCEREPHDRAERHEQDGIGWRTPAWYWPGNERP